MARLRMDPHAQWEIQEYARGMYNLVKPLFPEACQAFEDYAVNVVKFSNGEFELIKQLLNTTRYQGLVDAYGSEKALANEFNLGQRELTEFKTKLGL